MAFMGCRISGEPEWVIDIPCLGLRFGVGRRDDKRRNLHYNRSLFYVTKLLLMDNISRELKNTKNTNQKQNKTKKRPVFPSGLFMSHSVTGMWILIFYLCRCFHVIMLGKYIQAVFLLKTTVAVYKVILKLVIILVMAIVITVISTTSISKTINKKPE